MIMVDINIIRLESKYINQCDTYVNNYHIKDEKNTIEPQNESNLTVSRMDHKVDKSGNIDGADMSNSDIFSIVRELKDYIMQGKLGKIMDVTNYPNLSDMELLGISLLSSIIVLVTSVCRIILFLINDHILMYYNIIH